MENKLVSIFESAVNLNFEEVQGKLNALSQEELAELSCIASALSKNATQRIKVAKIKSEEAANSL